MIIDAHGHVFQRFHPHAPKRFRYAWSDSSPELFLSEMDHAGVDKAFLLSYCPEDVLYDLAADASGNICTKEYYIEAVRKYPSRFLWFTDHIHPDQPGYLDRLRADFDEGAVGAKVFPYYPTFPDEDGWMKVFELCASQGKPIIMDYNCYWTDNGKRCPGPRVGFVEYLTHLRPIARAFPKVKLSFAHMGWCLFYEGGRKPPFKWLEAFASLLEESPNFFTDLSGIAYTQEDYPCPQQLEFLRLFVRRIGASKIMWGTDWPCTDAYFTYKQTVTMIKNAATFLKEEEKQLILGGTAARFAGVME